MLIDTDVHEMLPNAMALYPYLEPQWQHVMKNWSWMGHAVNILPLAGAPYAVPGSTSRREWILDGVPDGSDPDLAMKHLFVDEEVSISILNGFYHVSAVEGFYEFYTALAAAYNDWQIETWLEKDSRFRGSVHVVAHDPLVAAREIDRVAQHPQIVQVFLPSITKVQYGDPFFRPIFEAAVRNRLVVTLHHGAGTNPAGAGWPRYWCEWHTNAPAHAAQFQLTNMIFQGLFEALPELKLVILEAGVTWQAHLLWRMDENYRQFRMEVPWVKRMPSEYLRENVRIGTQPFADIRPEHFQQLVEMSGTESMYVFATDYPHYDSDTARIILAKLSDDLRDRIRYKNALETYPRLKSHAA
jgi:predicted TIM-barrel fold metal-dependent hydrolase